jgi:ketosteroid isomerase-like protein
MFVFYTHNMDQNILTIERFYKAFQQKDATTMNGCYATDVVFHDPVFGLLQAAEVKAMWQMLCANAKNFSLVFGNIQTDDGEYYTCEWTASYLFSKTGRPVVNKCKAYMRMKDGVIMEHSDAFNFYRWCRQALGLPGILLGWSGFMHKRVGNNAKKQLLKYMQR